MVQLSSTIFINGIPFNNINELEIESSYNTLTDQAIIKLPRTFTYRGESGFITDKHIRRGFKLAIYLGYDFNNIKVFAGEIEDIKKGKTIDLTCTDTLRLKSGRISKSYKKAKLKDILIDILPKPPFSQINTQIVFECLDMELGNYRIENKTPLQVLEDLKKEYGIPSWFRFQDNGNVKLYSGLAFWPDIQKEYKIHVNGPESLIIDSDLIFKKEDEIFINCKAISIQPDNSKIEVEVGDEEGENRTLHFFNITSKESLKKLAEDKLKEFKYDGYRGSFTTFGFDHYQHGDIIELIDPKYKEKTGKYIIEKVVTNFGHSGYRQTVYISAKV